MIYRGFTYRLYPTQEQKILFEKFAGVCRLVYNLALEQRRDHWRQYQRSTGDNLNYVTQSRQLKDLRAQFDYIADVSQEAQGRALADLDAAFKRFFSGGGSFPKMKRKGVHDAFSFQGRCIGVKQTNSRWGHVKFPKIGWVKFRRNRPTEGAMTEASVSRTALGWQVSISCKIDRDIPDNGLTVGIDRGVAVPMMLSDGTSYTMPPQIDTLERRYRRAQRIASRRKKGSARWAKAMSRASQIKAKQARVRKHWAHEATTDIACRYGGAVIETLRIRNMTASASGTIAEPGTNVSQKRGLNRAIMNIGWHQIEVMLAYKMARLEKVNPSYTSQSCSCCGVIDKLSRKSQAVFECTACGFMENADMNAAKNILSRGNTSVLGVEGRQSSAPFEASTLPAYDR